MENALTANPWVEPHENTIVPNFSSSGLQKTMLDLTANWKSLSELQKTMPDSTANWKSLSELQKTMLDLTANWKSLSELQKTMPDSTANWKSLSELQKTMADSTANRKKELVTIEENQHTNVASGARRHKRSRVHTTNSTPYSRRYTLPEVGEEINNSWKVISSSVSSIYKQIKDVYKFPVPPELHPQFSSEDPISSDSSNKYIQWPSFDTDIRQMMLDTAEKFDYQAPPPQQNSGNALRRVRTRMRMVLPYARPADYLKNSYFRRLKDFIKPPIVNSYFKILNWLSDASTDFKDFLLIGNTGDDPFVLYMKENPSLFNQTNSTS
ncbi:12380_t:CDS:1 [Ambispora gerdemannii]|uniref:12380_t:CDS:1 n=1 Tax=Ambispora gerdemannii TaxID=144530 RepID=A0A9N8V2W8_9GLOM|nr:12380_t:CDS:1 [Ambispora gerdemannii]